MPRVEVGRLVGVVGLAALAAACQHTYGGLDVGDASRLDSGPAAARSVRFSDDGANAKLVFVATFYADAADTRVGRVDLMLECEHATGILHLMTRAPSDPTATVTLTSGGLRARIDTQRQVFDGGGLLLGATTTHAAPIMGLRRTGRLNVSIDGRSDFIRVDGSDMRAPVARFFRACDPRAS